MVREIKFRAWHEGQMHQVQTLMFNTEGIHFAGVLFGEYPAVGVHATSDVSDMVFMQYTGLKDRTGKEIYEGDIILRHVQWGNNRPEIVTFENGHWSYSYDLVEYCERPDEQWEVIGNVYETPDLVKTAEKEQPE